MSLSKEQKKTILGVESAKSSAVYSDAVENYLGYHSSFLIESEHGILEISNKYSNILEQLFILNKNLNLINEKISSQNKLQIKFQKSINENSINEIKKIHYQVTQILKETTIIYQQRSQFTSLSKLNTVDTQQLDKSILKKLNSLEEKIITLPKNIIDKTKLELSIKNLKIEILGELGEIKEKLREVKGKVGEVKQKVNLNIITGAGGIVSILVGMAIVCNFIISLNSQVNTIKNKLESEIIQLNTTQPNKTQP